MAAHLDPRLTIRISQTMQHGIIQLGSAAHEMSTNSRALMLIGLWCIGQDMRPYHADIRAASGKCNEEVRQVLLSMIDMPQRQMPAANPRLAFAPRPAFVAAPTPALPTGSLADYDDDDDNLLGGGTLV